LQDRDEDVRQASRFPRGDWWCGGGAPVVYVSRLITSLGKSALNLSTRFRGFESLTKSIRNTSSLSGLPIFEEIDSIGTAFPKNPRRTGKEPLTAISEGVGDGEIELAFCLSLLKRSRNLIGCLPTFDYAPRHLPWRDTMWIKLGKNIGNEWRDCAPYCPRGQTGLGDGQV
jgi:hypothetical protein